MDSENLIAFKPPPHAMRITGRAPSRNILNISVPFIFIARCKNIKAPSFVAMTAHWLPVPTPFLFINSYFAGLLDPDNFWTFLSRMK